MLRTGENWKSCTCHLVSHRINIFYLLDHFSKLTRIIPFFQTRENEKLITTFFIEYFPSPSVCHKNLRFCWKLLRTIIYSLELEKLIISCFSGGKKWKNVNLLQLIYRKVNRYTPYIDILNAIYRYFRYIGAIPTDLVLWNILSEIKQLKFSALMLDETLKISKLKQVSIAVMIWYHNNKKIKKQNFTSVCIGCIYNICNNNICTWYIKKIIIITGTIRTHFQKIYLEENFAEICYPHAISVRGFWICELFFCVNLWEIFGSKWSVCWYGYFFLELSVRYF